MRGRNLKEMFFEPVDSERASHVSVIRKIHTNPNVFKFMSPPTPITDKKLYELVNDQDSTPRQFLSRIGQRGCVWM